MTETRSTAASGTGIEYHMLRKPTAPVHDGGSPSSGPVVASPQSAAWTTTSWVPESVVQASAGAGAAVVGTSLAGVTACATPAGTRHAEATASSRTSLMSARRGI